jgi:hypothetical protein
MKALDYNIKKRKEEEKTTENHTEKYAKLTSQQVESAQQSAQRIPECSTGNADSKHGHPAAEHRAADQSTSEPQL